MTESTGKHALVVGGSGDIGRAIAVKLHDLGYTVCITGSTPDRVAAAKAWMLERAVDVHAVRMDVTEIDTIELAFAEAVGLLGGLDVLINCAGIVRPEFVAKSTTETWRETLEVNLLGPLRLIKAAVMQMRSQRSGYIVNIGSAAATDGPPGMSAYNASKAGLAALSASVRNEVERLGIKVTNIAPDKVDTRMHAVSVRESEPMIAPEDVAEAVSLVLRISPDATIHDLRIDTRSTRNRGR